MDFIILFIIPIIDEKKPIMRIPDPVRIYRAFKSDGHPTDWGELFKIAFIFLIFCLPGYLIGLLFFPGSVTSNNDSFLFLVIILSAIFWGVMYLVLLRIIKISGKTEYIKNEKRLIKKYKPKNFMLISNIITSVSGKNIDESFLDKDIIKDLRLSYEEVGEILMRIGDKLKIEIPNHLLESLLYKRKFENDMFLLGDFIKYINRLKSNKNLSVRDENQIDYIM